ncbi:hypothetical protein GRJ2_003483000 [Grus japonensis]|uniref:Uncharacterized protein n=1 Tax=Grus japonensis TaxID=30415 RepID=A0ABC9YLF5_GRUJA
MPASSKTDPLLAKAEPISDSGSTSVITYLRRGKNCCTTAAAERGVRICERNNSADTKGSGGGGGGVPGTRAEIPLQPVEKTIVRQAVPLQPMEVNGGADIHLQPLEDPTPEQVDVPKGDCDSVESLHWSRFAGRTCDPVGNPCWSSLVLKDCTLWKGPTLEQFMKN